MSKKGPLKASNLFPPHSFNLIAGPCAIESEERLRSTAKALSKLGIKMLRGGSYKMRTQPASFQGLGEEGLQILQKVANEFGMLSVSEITSESQIPFFTKYVDVIMVGMRNMYNYPLLQALSKIEQPIILKRNFSATMTEFIGSYQYLAQNGKSNIILCERGIRTFSDATRNTLDLGAVVYLRHQYPDLTIICDPSHASGNRDLVADLTLASLAAGAQGAIIEVDFNPETSVSDSAQTIGLSEISTLIKRLKSLGRGYYE
jgi:3-deoxy-7-phosphoheptulonate synthase